MNCDHELRPVYPPVHKRDSRFKRLRCVYALLLVGFWLVGCDDDPLTDLSILDIRVVQDASASADAARLAAQRGTVVRVRLETGSSYDVADVAGSLSVWVDGVVAATDLAAVNAPVTVFSARNRTLEDASLYFEFDASAGVHAGRDVDFFVTVTAPGQFVQGGASDPIFAGPNSSSANYPLRTNPSSPMLMSPDPSEKYVISSDHVNASQTARHPPRAGE